MWSCFIFLECNGVSSYYRWYLQELNLLGAGLVCESELGEISNDEPIGKKTSSNKNLKPDSSLCGSITELTADTVYKPYKADSKDTHVTIKTIEKSNKHDYISSLDISREELP